MNNAEDENRGGWIAAAQSALGYFDREDRLYPLIILCVFGAIAAGSDPYPTALVGLGSGVAWPAIRWLTVVSRIYQEHHERTIEWRLRANEIAEEHTTAEELSEVRKSVDDFEQGKDGLE